MLAALLEGAPRDSAGVPVACCSFLSLVDAVAEDLAASRWRETNLSYQVFVLLKLPMPSSRAMESAQLQTCALQGAFECFRI